jgi:hypothetical protein
MYVIYSIRYITIPEEEKGVSIRILLQKEKKKEKRKKERKKERNEFSIYL